MYVQPMHAHTAGRSDIPATFHARKVRVVDGSRTPDVAVDRLCRHPPLYSGGVVASRFACLFVLPVASGTGMCGPLPSLPPVVLSRPLVWHKPSQEDRRTRGDLRFDRCCTCEDKATTAATSTAAKNNNKDLHEAAARLSTSTTSRKSCLPLSGLAGVEKQLGVCSLPLCPLLAP